MIERKLKNLFDYQRFERNGKFEKLETLIRETESRYAKELSDEDLSMVSAAGDADINTTPVRGDVSVGGLTGSVDTKSSEVFGYNIGKFTGDFVGNSAENNKPK